MVYTIALGSRTIVNIQVTRAGLERNEELRNQFQAVVAELYPPETHVYLDESACNRHTSNRDRAWAPIGDRARRHDFFVREGACSVTMHCFGKFGYK
jgi:hypothetical protein